MQGECRHADPVSLEAGQHPVREGAAGGGHLGRAGPVGEEGLVGGEGVGALEVAVADGATVRTHRRRYVPPEVDEPEALKPWVGGHQLRR